MKKSKTFHSKNAKTSKSYFKKNTESISNLIDCSHENQDEYSLSRNSIKLEDAKINSSNHENEKNTFY